MSKALFIIDVQNDFTEGGALGVDFGITSSCYDPGPKAQPCGSCDACLLRAKGFAEAGVSDPLLATIARTWKGSIAPEGSGAS